MRTIMPAAGRQLHIAPGGRKLAGRIAETTGRSSAAWIAEFTGVERRRRAAAQRIARLVGTDFQWSGEISTEDWQTVLTAGADALLALAGSDSWDYSLGLADAAEEYAAEAARLGDDQVVDRTRGGLAEARVDELLASMPADLVDAERTPSEAAAVERWSPFRSGPRWAFRRPMAYADGTPAPVRAAREVA